ncbi:MAG: helix-turn-helix domain-containing protein [Paludibacteraceae bacterium]|nr:helix-turn-helix domain-containing protein [Paludibacteraceae bacterium]
MATGLTELGAFLRKLRIDRRELLRDMAEKLNVSMSFLSSVENGKKNMPSDWVDKIPSLYKLTDTQKKELDAAIAESENGIGIKFNGLSEDDKRLSVAFARKIKNLDSKEQQILQQILF